MFGPLAVFVAARLQPQDVTGRHLRCTLPAHRGSRSGLAHDQHIKNTMQGLCITRKGKFGGAGYPNGPHTNMMFLGSGVITLFEARIAQSRFIVGGLVYEIPVSACSKACCWAAEMGPSMIQVLYRAPYSERFSTTKFATSRAVYWVAVWQRTAIAWRHGWLTGCS